MTQNRAPWTPGPWEDVVIGPENELQLPSNGVATPATPAAGFLKLFVRAVAGRLLPSIVGPSGLDVTLQPNFFRNKIGRINPTGYNTTTVAADGINLTAVGTATAVNMNTTNRQGQMRRVEYLVTTAATTAVAGYHTAGNAFWRSASADVGGFFFSSRCGPATGVTNSSHRFFVGLNQAAPTDVNPSTLTNMVGFGYDAADTQWQFMVNDGSGTATKVALGASFPKPNADRTKMFDATIFSPPGASYIDWEFTDLNTGAKTSGRATTDLPATDQMMRVSNYISVGGVSSVVGLALTSTYIETDY